MKSGTLLLLALSTTVSFIGTYFFNLTAENAEMFLALLSVVFLDGFMGISAAVKRGNFETRKALKVIQTAVVWVIILAVVLIVESAYKISWLTETILFPFIIFQLTSALKNAANAELIQTGVLKNILDKIDNHKDLKNLKEEESEENI
jgi:phage-related holin